MRAYSANLAFWQLSKLAEPSTFNRTINLHLVKLGAKALRNKITNGECHVGQYR
jgi:hypothetical protein